MATPPTNSNLPYWVSRWSNKTSGWHMDTVEPRLLKYYQLITGKPLPGSMPLSPDSEEFVRNSAKKWFIPLTGKSVDVSFLLRLGYQVFGVEAIPQPIQEMNEEQRLGLQWNEQNSCFEGGKGRLQIFHGDFFRCPIEQFRPFDYVWDRASLVAVEYDTWNAYIQVMQRALKGPSGNYGQFRYLLETVSYDRTKTTYEGAPHAVSDDEVQQLYASWTNVRKLEANPMDYSTMDIGPTEENFFLIEPK